MATAASLRAQVRTQLEETAAAIWTDDEIDACVTSGLTEYGLRFPIDVVSTVAIPDGATSTALPTGAITVRRVILAGGVALPRRGSPAWEVYAGTLSFSEPLSAQTLTIQHTAAATLDSLPAGDESLVVASAVLSALQQRAIADYKRGGQLSQIGDGVLAQARDAVTRAYSLRARRVRVGTVG